MLAILRVYADTSVFGGCFDPEFADPSRVFFDQASAGRFVLTTSAVVAAELSAAPPPVREHFGSMLGRAELIDVTDEALGLQRAYVDAGIVTVRSANDALHVAVASVARCDAIVSWNFRHIVHFEKVPLYNAVNTLRRYPPIAICSPREVIRYEDEDA